MAIGIAGLVMKVTAPRAAIDYLTQYYGHMACEVTSANAEVFVWEGTDLVRQDHGVYLRASRKEQIASLTILAIQQRLAELRPELLLIHGNVVTRREGEQRKALALIGESGSGKSSQTLALISQGMGASHLLAEDLLLFDLEKELVWPHLRAATMRSKGGETLCPAEQVDEEPLKLDMLEDIFLLFGRLEEKADGFHVAVSHLPDAVAREWGGHEGLAISSDREGFSLLHFEKPPKIEELGRLMDLLSSEKSMVLWAGPAAPRRQSFPFGSEPRIERLSVLEAHGALLKSMIRMRWDAGADSSARLFRLFSGISRSRFWNLEPGGSPEITAAAMMKVLSENGT